MEKTKFIIIESRGPLTSIGVSGPIRTPFRLDVSKIIKLVCDGKIVYEVNPLNKNEKVRLTRDNVLRINFTNKQNEMIQPIIKKPQAIDTSNQTKTEIKKNPAIDTFIANKHS